MDHRPKSGDATSGPAGPPADPAAAPTPAPTPGLTVAPPHLRTLDPPTLGPARGYANGILVAPGGALLFVAGQIGWDETQTLVPGGMAAQFLRALDNLLTVVAAAGGRPTDVVRLTVFVTDKAAYVAVRRELAAGWRERFGRHYPAMTLVEVRALLEPGALVEIEATAAIRTTATPATAAAAAAPSGR